MKNIKIKKVKEKLDVAPFEQWLNKSVSLLIDLYGIGGVTVMMHEKGSAGENRHSEGVVLFRINYSAAYKTANIWYYPYTVQLFKDKKFDILRQAITHEIAHILTNPLSELASQRYVSRKEIDDMTENLTETVGQLCRKLMDAKNLKLDN